jgi:hypothetical protein
LKSPNFWAPGRHARLSDFVVDALAARIRIEMASMFAKVKSSDFALWDRVF